MCCALALRGLSMEGAAPEVQTDINTNAVYGSTADLAETLFKRSGCSPIGSDSMQKTGEQGCIYFSIFENQNHAEHEFAANCVPATVSWQPSGTLYLFFGYGFPYKNNQPQKGCPYHNMVAGLARCARRTLWA